MAKKSLKEAAAAGTSVFDQLITGVQNAQDATDVQDALNVLDAQPAKKSNGGRPRKFTEPTERFNLKIPVAIKEYLTVAAARESITRRSKVSPTDYLCELVRADMEKHNNE